MGGAPITGLAIRVYPGGIGLAIRMFDFLSSDKKGPVRLHYNKIHRQ